MRKKLIAGMRWLWGNVIKPVSLWVWHTLLKPSLQAARAAFFKKLGDQIHSLA